MTQGPNYRPGLNPAGKDFRVPFQRLEGDVGTLQAGNFTSRTVRESGVVTVSDVELVLTGYATIVLTLPTALNVAGKFYTIKNAQSISATVATTGQELIGNASTLTLNAGDGILVQSDGANWQVILQRGVTSLSKSGSAHLTGDVTLTGSGAVTLTQSGQNIDIGATAGSVFTYALSLSAPTAGFPWTVPVAVTEFLGKRWHRTKFDLTNFTQARLLTSQDAVPGGTPILAVQYSTDAWATNHYLDGGTGPSIAISAIGINDSGWVNIAAGAKADVQLRVVGSDALNFADVFGSIWLEVK